MQYPMTDRGHTENKAEGVFMKQKLRFGAGLMIAGGLLAVVGEIINAQNTDALSSSWRPSLILIIIGTFLLLIGLAIFGAISSKVNGLGFFGTTLLIVGGLLVIIGTVALDWILLPLLTEMANTIGAAINQPTAAAQNELNNIINTLNGLERLFPGAPAPISAVNIPKTNGSTLINSVLVQLNIPTIDQLTWWGHFCLSGGPLTLGSLILGLALTSGGGRPTLPAALLIIFAPLNLFCQFFMAALFGNITALIFFLTVAWIGFSVWSSYDAAIRDDRRQ